MHLHYTTYTHGDIVYLKTDESQTARMVVSIWLRPSGVLYELGCGSDSSDHYEIEMSGEPNETIRLGLKSEEK